MPTHPSHADLASLLTTAERIAHGVDQILLQGFGKVTASQKADGSLVTQTDHAADEYINQHLSAAYPDHDILSEERNTTYRPAAEFTWVIDPLDGTTNFAHGLPIWGVSIALQHSGVPVIGLVSFPSLREIVQTIKDNGATCNGTPIHTATNEAVDSQHFLMSCTRTQRHYQVNTPLKPRIMGSAAYHIIAVANGSALAGIEATPKLWDIAAALLILSEAGGTYQQLDSSDPTFPLAPKQQNYERIAFPMLAAANQSIMREMEQSLVERK